MKIDFEIGKFVEAVCEFKGVELKNNIELDIRDLSCMVDTPSGSTLIKYIVKKENITGVKIRLVDGSEIRCAGKHILLQNGVDVYADTLSIGDYIDTVSGSKNIVSIDTLEDTTFYDIGIDAPHLYVDDQGIIHHNTIITAALSKKVEQYGRSIVIVPNKSLVNQTEADYINLGLDVGVYFGDRKEYNKTHTICTWQSLNNLLKNTKAHTAEVSFGEFVEGVVCVIVDEVHSAKSNVLKSLLTREFANIPIRWGLTGTVPKEDFNRLSLVVSLGPVIGKLSASELQDKGVLAKCNVNIIQTVDDHSSRDYASELKFLTEHKPRLQVIADLVSEVSNNGNTLILVGRISTGQSLLELLKDRGKEASFVSGSTKMETRKEQYDEIKSSYNKIILATYGVAAVGINIPRIFNLVLIEPGKSFVRVIQSIGRGIRKAKDKEHVEIWDLTSTCKFSKRHLTQRKAFYREANYPFNITKTRY